MSKFLITMFSTLACLATTGLLHGAVAQEARSGTLKAVQGEVTLQQNQAPSRPASLGGAVAQAERIVTGRSGSAVLMLKDGTVVSIGPGSTVDLSHFKFEPTTQDGGFMIGLLQGSIRVVTGLLGKLHPDKVSITTPTAVVGVRGTDFIVEVP